MTTPFEVLFSVTVYRDGRITVAGRPRTGTTAASLPAILRMIADAIEAGDTVLEDGLEDDAE